ncbi:MAG: glycoside hydrolase family 19 protein [Fibrobacterota bacterium]
MMTRISTALFLCFLVLQVFSAETDLDTNIIDNGDGTFSVRKSWLLSEEMRMTADPLYDEVKQTIRTIPNEEVEKIVPGRAENPANVKRVEQILTQEKWDYLTPVKAPEYTYTGFLRAVGKFPAFCGDYNDGRDADAIARRAIATCFAHFAQETGAGDDYMAETEGIPRWRQGLHYVREMNYEEGMSGYSQECGADEWQNEKWPCGKTEDGEWQGYFGRGAKQLSYHYNYGAFSDAMYEDATVLLDDPGLVASTWLNLASAIFFYVYPRPPKPSMLHVMDGTWQPNAVDSAQGIVPGFGATINVINGGIECGPGSEGKKQPLNRVNYYKNICEYLGVPIDEDEQLGCEKQDNFITGGAGAMLIQWDNDWSYDPARPHGNFACQLVGYETAESALEDDGYINCVKRYYPNVQIIDDMGDTKIIEEAEVDAGNISRGIYPTANPVRRDAGSSSLVVITGDPALVQIAVFDMTGNLLDLQESRSSVSEGALFSWDMKNRAGAAVAPGTYVIYATMEYADGSVERYKEVLGIKK